MSRLSCAAIAGALSVPVLAGCGADPAPLSDHSLTELCQQPEQLLADVWNLPEPVVGTAKVPNSDHIDRIGAGGHCTFDANGASVASLSLIRDTPGFGDPPNDAHAISVGEHTVKTWAIHSIRLTFEAVIGGWEASITLTPGADLHTGKPAATDDQMKATANKLVDILAEFKGPDFTPTPH
ncbi:MAG: hypothetical protein GX610_13780 [Rhodococcus sp.]|nr:hypothetical protein [Rhodococcus sp. (in: high G+C Gram-positive bacteria)]